MIEIILNMLSMDDFYNISEEIEIAKGKNKLAITPKEAFKKAKRKGKWQKR